MTRYLTTAEAMEFTRHKEARYFVKWAKRHAPEILIPLPGRREYLIDSDKLAEFFQRRGIKRNVLEPSSSR